MANPNLIPNAKSGLKSEAMLQMFSQHIRRKNNSDVGAHSLFFPMENWPDLQVMFSDTEGGFNFPQTGVMCEDCSRCKR